MTSRMMTLAALAVAALTADTARAERCEAQRAHDLGCTLECVRANNCSNSACSPIIAQCDAYFNSQGNTRCGAFCRDHQGGTYRSINTCLQQCNSGPMPKKPASRATPASTRPGKPEAQKPTAGKPTPPRSQTKPTSYGSSSKPSTYGTSNKPRSQTRQKPAPHPRATPNQMDPTNARTETNY